MRILKRNQLIVLVVSLMLITAGYLNFTTNQENVATGNIVVDRNRQPKDRYDAESRVIAGFLSVDWNIRKNIL